MHAFSHAPAGKWQDAGALTMSSDQCPIADAGAAGTPRRHRARRRLSAAVIACAGWPASAAAAAPEGHGGEQSGATIAVVAVLLVVAVAYLLAHFVVGRLQKTFLVTSGFEYLLLGVLLGPLVPTQIPAFSSVHTDLLPIVALSVGWVGLLRGMQLDVRKIRASSPTGATRLVAGQTVMAGILVTLPAGWLLQSGLLYCYADPPINGCVDARQAWISAGVLGCVAAAGSVQPLELLRTRYQLEGDTVHRIRRMAAMADLLAITVFGLLFCFFHRPIGPSEVQPSPAEWALLSVLLGGLLGLLFTPFLGEDDSENGRFLAMVGIITLASGAAYFLQLSPLFVNLCLGVVLVNTTQAGAKIQATLERTRRPMSLVLWVFAGALWKPPDASVPVETLVRFTHGWPLLTSIVELLVPWLLPLLFCAMVLGLRFVGKVLGAALAAIRSDPRRDFFRGLFGQGTVSVAMAVSFRLVYTGPASDLAYTVILMAVVVGDWVGPRMLRGLLVDTGDIKGPAVQAAAK